MLLRRLVFFFTEFQVLLVVKLSKIGENSEKSRKIFVFEANKTAKAKIFFGNFYINKMKEFNCAKISSKVDGLGRKGFLENRL